MQQQESNTNETISRHTTTHRLPSEENTVIKDLPRISFCIICMDRLYHLKETILKNIRNNIGYGNFEVILLDYNSGDNMEQWVKDNLAAYIAQGIVTYYKTFEPQEFSHSHAKNLAFRLATGDIVCNINADNFVGEGFTDYIYTVFREGGRVFIRPDLGMGFDLGCAGVVCVGKADFLTVGGFDERMSVYGWEDVDFNNRLQFAGVGKRLIQRKAFLEVITHVDKYDKKKLSSRIQDVYINTLDPLEAACVKVLILFKNNTCKYGTVVNNVRKCDDEAFARIFEAREFKYQYELEEVHWHEGYWQQAEDTLTMLDTAYVIQQQWQQSTLNGGYILQYGTGNPPFYQVTNEDLLDRITYFEMDYNNRLVLINNREHRTVTVNNGVFGRGRVFKNFNYEISLDIS